MAEQTSTNGWRRALGSAVISASLAAGLLTGVSSASAVADPSADAAAASDAAPAMTADQALAIIAADYDTGSGGGQISNLIEKIMKLRARGIRPSTSNQEAIVAALDKRPNQGPLVEALESTLSYQMRQASRQTGGGPVLNPPTIGIGGGGGGIPNPNGGGGVNIPLG
ncbi:hypothetical protein H7K45_23575 [Mycobacterium yunnanensis]|uniref:DUF732 domain-containing protein n=1 Tax=Mycobacterium yunnanensis TaxID=368477 RepID=A0A9X2Z7E4_9MYCO|nr:hypothetical protein [Mycobacterium yunnanensis]MCV7423540.1 hypothetical protein [Mycobacterium yunnanensis]